LPIKLIFIMFRWSIISAISCSFTPCVLW